MHPRTFWPRLLLGLQSLDIWPFAVRRALIRTAGATIAPSATFAPGTAIVLGSLNVGEHVFVNRNCLLEAAAGITIADGVAIGPRVTIVTLSHEIQSAYPRAGPVRWQRVSIGRGSWVGASATILPGTTIGDGCVVAAGALVRGTLAPNGLYAGVPAVRIRDLPEPAADPA